MVYYTGQMNDPQLTERLDNAGIDFRREIQAVQQHPDDDTAVLCTASGSHLRGYGLCIPGHVQRRAASMGVGKSTAKVYVQKQTGVTFKGCGRSGGGQGISP